VGNISLKDNKPMVHAHLTLADEKGKAFGGHLAPGTIVYACEYLIQSFEGAILKRELDEKTDLSLWQS
jgi:predicted DNA-binding protein with PD1-like motif